MVAEPPLRFARLPEGAARDEVEARLSDWLLDLLIDELETDAGYATMPGEVDDLAESLRELSRHLAERLRRFSTAPAAALALLLHSGERAIEATFGAGGPLVSGRLDALYADALGGLEVVEYKLTDEANDELDRAQVALYRELLRLAQGTEARPVVLRFSPTLREMGRRRLARASIRVGVRWRPAARVVLDAGLGAGLLSALTTIDTGGSYEDEDEGAGLGEVMASVGYSPSDRWQIIVALTLAGIAGIGERDSDEEGLEALLPAAHPDFMAGLMVGVGFDVARLR